MPTPIQMTGEEDTVSVNLHSLQAECLIASLSVKIGPAQPHHLVETTV